MSIRIRLATYNVHKCRGLDRRTSPERIASVIAELDADVVAIQEVLNVVDGRSQDDQARRIHRALNGYNWCFGENRTLHGGPYGNMTLSRFPLKFCRNYDLTWRHRERRGCLRTDIAVSKAVLLHVFNVHLGTSFFERRHQGRKLLSDEVLKGPNTPDHALSWETSTSGRAGWSRAQWKMRLKMSTLGRFCGMLEPTRVSARFSTSTTFISTSSSH